MSMDDKVLRGIVSRLERLERAFLRSGKKAVDTAHADSKKYKGATGGIRLLVDEGYFDKKRPFGEICKALESKGYHYSKQAVQTPLNNLSSTKSKLLVAITANRRKLYAKRK
jgi:hypothetical protein